MVDYAKEYGIDVDVLMTERFSHPIAQWENARIVDQGVAYWEWYRHQHPEAPKEEPVVVRTRRKYERRERYVFTDRQLEIAMRSIRDAR